MERAAILNGRYGSIFATTSALIISTEYWRSSNIGGSGLTRPIFARLIVDIDVGLTSKLCAARSNVKVGTGGWHCHSCHPLVQALHGIVRV